MNLDNLDFTVENFEDEQSNRNNEEHIISNVDNNENENILTFSNEHPDEPIPLDVNAIFLLFLQLYIYNYMTYKYGKTIMNLEIGHQIHNFDRVLKILGMTLQPILYVFQ